MTGTTRVSFLVIGGGIGGLAAALALAHAGRRVHVIEKSPEFGEIGAGLQLAPNASRALDRLGVVGEIAKVGVYPKRLVMLDAVSGDVVTALDVGAKFRARYGYPYVVMHRHDLLAILLAACRANDAITLETGKDSLEVDDRGDHAVARCADGSSYAADAVIGADGLWSPTRRFVAGDAKPVCAQFVAYRGTIPISAVSSHAGLDNVVMWAGPDLHLVQYPVRRAELFNQVAVFRSHRYVEGSDDWGTVEELDAAFAPTCAPVRSALTQIGRGRRWPMFDRPPIAQWTRNRVALLGDAAHPMLQYLAQGACQALEDAVCIGREVAKHGDDVAAALLAYQQARYLRTARVQLTAHFFGDVCHVADVGATLRNTLLADRPHDDFSAVDWLYGHAV